MVDRNKKEQLGARVTPGVRQRCIDAAARAKVSLNVWVEAALMLALHSQHMEELAIKGAPVIEGQTTVDDFVEEDASTGVRASSTKPFAPDCSMDAYHWRCSPGNPCKRCGGEA